MGKDGTQLLRHCVRLLVLVSTDLLSVRLSGIISSFLICIWCEYLSMSMLVHAYGHVCKHPIVVCKHPIVWYCILISGLHLV